MMLAILSLIFIFTTALMQPGCNGKNVKKAALDREFNIKVGEEVLIENEPLEISFSLVAEDSRCPKGVQCIWAGNAKVVLKVSKSKKDTAEINLNTEVDPKRGSYQGYEIKLVALNPYPKNDVKIEKSDYVATLIVSRNGHGETMDAER